MKTDNLIEKQQKEHNVALVDYEDDCNKLCKFINNLYENVDKNVIKLLNKNNKKKHRKGKITYNDVLLYRFLYSFIHTSK